MSTAGPNAYPQVPVDGPIAYIMTRDPCVFFSLLPFFYFRSNSFKTI